MVTGKFRRNSGGGRGEAAVKGEGKGDPTLVKRKVVMHPLDLPQEGR